MKKIFSLIAALLCFAFASSAQTSALKITNHTSCDVNFVLMGAYAPGCSVASVSTTVITLSPGGTMYFPDPAAVPIPGLAATDYIVGAILYEWPPACGSGSTYKIGEACAGLPNSVAYNTINNSCRSECFIKAVWTSGGSNLDFYP